MSQPIQPIITDDAGIVRFKANAIVAHLLDKGGISLNDIAVMDFSREDREQLNQLIGYSVSAWGGLESTTNESWEAVSLMQEQGHTSVQARLEAVEGELEALRADLAGPMARLFNKHPDDLQ